MPTFETDSPTPQPEHDGTDSVQEFRPRKRDNKRSQRETFTPPEIPPEVKDTINERIGNIVRQSKGPDEKLFAMREVLVFFRKLFDGIGDLFRRRFGKNGDDADVYDADGNRSGPSNSYTGGFSGRNGQYKRRGGRNRRRRKSN
ncbi:MAG: hypothetical protein JW942_09835 [Opitutales bacterium]|nr:hypothetical protein [Opitutales bacterium]